MCQHICPKCNGLGEARFDCQYLTCSRCQGLGTIDTAHKDRIYTGNLLHAWRRSRGLTAGAAAREIDCSRERFRRMENGYHEIPSCVMAMITEGSAYTSMAAFARASKGPRERRKTLEGENA